MIMKISSLSGLQELLKDRISSSVCFKSDIYPIYFLSSLFAIMVQRTICKKPRFINLLELEIDVFESLLHQYVLDVQDVFWLGDCTAIFSEKKYARFKNSIENYTGPKILFYFIDEKKCKSLSKNHVVISLPPLVAKNELVSFSAMFFKEELFQKKKYMIDAFYARYKTISLDMVLHFFDYLELVNVSLHKDLLSYIEPAYENSNSLFTITTLFFAKNKNDFFQEWNKVESKYPTPFWISFWADQLWRAHYVIYFLEKNAIDDARKMSRKLPFSFLKLYWKHTSQAELRNAYTFIFTADCSFKTGSTFCFFDLFFIHFFSGAFSKKTLT